MSFPEGGVLLKPVGLADPAAGTEVSVTVPANTWWGVIAVRASLVTAVAAATRIPQLVVDDGAIELFRSNVAAGQTASLTQFYQWNACLVEQRPAAGANAVTNLFMPEWVLSPGFRIRTVTAAIQAADDWGVPLLYVVEYGSQPY